MKKRIISAILIILMLISLAGCGSNVSKYPLSEGTVKKLAKGFDSDLSVKQTTDDAERTVFELNAKDSNGDEKTVFLVTTAVVNGEKGLQIAFAGQSQTHITGEFYSGRIISPEEAEDILVFAAEMYGMEDKKAIYDAFSEEYKVTNTEVLNEDIYGISYAWQSEIEGHSCKVVFKDVDSPEISMFSSVTIR